MQIVLREKAELERILDYLNENDTIKSDVVIEENNKLINLFGDISSVNKEELESFEEVEKVIYISESYKKANRKMYHNDSIIDVCGKKFGGGFFNVIAGPCSIESKEQLMETAESVKKSGAGLLRGGAFKPRTSPYTFQGLRNDGLDLLLETKKLTGMPIVTEIMRIDSLDLFEDVDIIQVGTRNMQNFELLKELGKTNKTILLKRGMSSTLDELLMSAEYIMAGGNSNIILCERGIRTFETSMRNTLDISAIPMLKKKNTSSSNNRSKSCSRLKIYGRTIIYGSNSSRS